MQIKFQNKLQKRQGKGLETNNELEVEISLKFQQNITTW